MFSRAWHRFHVFLRLSPVAFSRAWHGLRVFRVWHQLHDLASNSDWLFPLRDLKLVGCDWSVKINVGLSWLPLNTYSHDNEAQSILYRGTHSGNRDSSLSAERSNHCVYKVRSHMGPL